MWRTNLRVLAVAIGTIGFYTVIAHSIPQLQSEVPETLALGSNATPEALVAAGERIYNGAGGCAACHGLGTRAPNLLTDDGSGGTIGARCDRRKPGMGCKEYLHESMVAPGAFVVPGFDPIMPDMRRQLADDQIWALVAYLQSLGGEVTVTAADIQPAAGSAQRGAAAPTGAGAMTATTDPVQLFTEKGCVGCHVLGGTGGQVGPPLDAIGRTRDAAYIRRAILQPNADTAKGFEKFAGAMPPTYGQQLTAAQLEALVAHLASRR
jgi:mono/diheme cytochrome c family protein